MSNATSSARFSVIVPLYRVERYVTQCINSLKAQTFGDFEALCVNDGSPDESLAVARQAAGDDERFRFFSLEQNQGQSAARNRGLEHATGDLLLLLDADDYLASNALELIDQRFESQNLDELYLGAVAFYESAEAYRRCTEDFSRRPAFPDVASGMEVFTHFEEQGQFYPSAPFRVVHRSLVEDNGIRFREGIIHEDLLFTFQTLVLSKRSSFLSEPVYKRRVHLGSTSTTARRSFRNIDGHLESIRFMKRWMTENASCLDARFVTAMAHRLNEYLNACVDDYLNDITDDEKAAYLETLTPVARVEFELEVAQRAEVARGIYNSLTWRAGKAATALPRMARDALAAARRNRQAD